MRPKIERTRLDVEQRRAQLVELGIEHFGRAPYDDVSIDAIAEAAGISKGLLYHYFPTKKAYYAACILAASKDLVARTERASKAGAVPLEQLAAGLDAYLDYVRAHAAAYTTLMRSGVGVDPEIARIVDETREQFIIQLVEEFPREVALPRTPLLKVALRGWVGLAEAVSLGWLEELESEVDGVPSQREIRDLLANALIQIVQVAAAPR